MRESEYSEAGKAIRDLMRVSTPKAWFRGTIGALLGAAIGGFVFFVLHDRGWYGLMIPGALTGLGFGLCSKRSFFSAGLFCAMIGLVVMLWCEWQILPKFKDKEFAEFLRVVPRLDSGTKIMLAAGTIFAFWFGKGR